MPDTQWTTQGYETQVQIYFLLLKIIYTQTSYSEIEIEIQVILRAKNNKHNLEKSRRCYGAAAAAISNTSPTSSHPC